LKNGKLPTYFTTAFNNTLKQALFSESIVDNPRKNRPFSLIVVACKSNAKELVEWDPSCVKQMNKENQIISFASKQCSTQKKLHPISGRNGSHDLDNGTF
jgi:hypothetical protein